MTNSSDRPTPSWHQALLNAEPVGQPRRGTQAQPAWQRWDMWRLDQPAALPETVALDSEPEAPPPPVPPQLDEAEIERLRAEAYEAAAAEGRQAGWQEGFQQGRNEGIAQGRSDSQAEVEAGLAELREQTERLRSLAAALPEALRQAEAELSDTMVELALAVARQVVNRKLSEEPQWIVALVRDLMRREPTLQGAPRLLLHPADFELVQQQLADELQAQGWQLGEDEQIRRGGCRVQSAETELDARVETRWQRATAALGLDAETRPL